MMTPSSPSSTWRTAQVLGGLLRKVIGDAPVGLAMGKAPLYFPVDAIGIMWPKDLNLDLHLELNNSDTNNRSQYVSMDYR